MPEAATKDDIDAVNRRLDDLINIGRVGLTAVNAHTTQITEINRRLGRIETTLQSIDGKMLRPKPNGHRVE